MIKFPKHIEIDRGYRFKFAHTRLRKVVLNTTYCKHILNTFC